MPLSDGGAGNWETRIFLDQPDILSAMASPDIRLLFEDCESPAFLAISRSNTSCKSRVFSFIEYQMLDTVRLPRL